MARTKDSCTENISGNAWELLASEIVLQAVKDWRMLIEGKDWNTEFKRRWCNFDELRVFFKSQWCELLMQGCEIEPLEILQILEEELRNAERADGIACNEERS